MFEESKKETPDYSWMAQRREIAQRIEIRCPHCHKPLDLTPIKEIRSW